jgi:hypothetical protein
MHVSSKVSDRDGAHHTITSVIEADGAFELAKADQDVKAEIVGVVRTLSGGIEVTTLVTVSDKAPKEDNEDIS